MKIVAFKCNTHRHRDEPRQHVVCRRTGYGPIAGTTYYITCEKCADNRNGCSCDTGELVMRCKYHL